ncbi:MULTISPECIES: hypothetical protein [Burkholderiales]|uniref:Uncharacterized protein n=2 Tax=Pandoraea TaxID=93217 RepID=A0A5E4WSD5_9BURK|nr:MULTISPECIES: hypothetical protein [Burkholderiales]ALS62274.1 hypothetical protein AT302_23280 [Pandoraea norimbergensis]OXS89452.1 hypothetical protein B7H01_19280 [Pandoraea apista]VVE27153.1 hypothetical protein PCO31111_03461 [Pandoraea communis]
MQTNVITYNLKERGRQYRGKERHFNIRAIVAAINGPACQERVRNRDMQGYYGHWPRIKFGLNPAEGGLEGGKPSIVEPALVTTLLRAHDDGTIEHQAEFLDTDSGQVAAKLYASRTGGFSSAIDQTRPEFFGFDYVLEPNYSTNRGYTLDDVRDMTLDDIEAAIYDEQLRGMAHLLDAANSERERACEVIERLSAENEQLLSMLAAKGIDAGVALDAAGIAPLVLAGGVSERMARDMAAFHSAGALPRFVEPKQEEPPADPLYGRLIGKFTR